MFAAHLYDLPPARQLVAEILLRPRDDRGVVTLLHLVLGANDDVAALGVPEKEHLLRRKGDHEDGDVVVENFTG